MFSTKAVREEQILKIRHRNKMADLNPAMLIIILNTNKHYNQKAVIVKMDKKQDSIGYCLQEILHTKRQKLKVKGWKREYHANTGNKRAWVPTSISEKIKFKTRNIIGDKKWHYSIIKGQYIKNI